MTNPSKDHPVKIRLYVRTQYVGSKVEDVVEIDREDWEDMSTVERDELLFETVVQMIEWGYEVDGE